MSLARKSVQDFIAQVNARTPGVQSGATYSATLNANGAVQITKNGTVLYGNVFWGMGVGQSVTDLNISGDSVDVLAIDGTVQSGDAALFIQSLT